MSRLFLRYVKRALPLKQMALLLILAVLAVTAGTYLYGQLSKDIQVIDNGKPVAVRTMGSDVEQAFGHMGISVGQYDYVSASMDTALTPIGTNTVTIKRAVPVNLTVDGETQSVYSYKDTVEEIVRDNGIAMGPLDRYEGVNPKDPVVSDMDIRVVRIREEILTEEEQIPFNILEQPNKVLNEGQNKTVVEGENGVREKYYKITYEDGKPVNRQFLNESVVKNPVDRVVEYGTVPNFTNSRGDLVRYSKVLKLKATAYTNSYRDCLKNPGDYGYGITYSGLKVRTGIIAVDPKVIPLGTKVYVEIPGKAPDYGFAIAADIGSAIKGNLIDLYFDTNEEAVRWGKKNVVVYVLNEQNDARWKENTDPCK